MSAGPAAAKAENGILGARCATANGDLEGLMMRNLFGVASRERECFNGVAA